MSAPHRLWRNARYLTWLVSDTSKGLAAALFGFAIPLLALIVTNDPAQAGIIGGAGMVARLLTTLAGGILADRHPRILLMLIGSLLGVLLSGAFVMLALADALTFATLLVIDVLLAARSGLFDVAGESAIKEIVPDEAMGRAQAANQGRDAALQLAGGPLGGLLLGVGGWLVGVVMTACHLVAAATAWMLRREVRAAGMVDSGADADATGSDEHAIDAPGVEGAAAPAPATAAKPNAWREIREGFGWLLSRPDLSGVLFITTIINLGFNAAITTVIYSLQQEGHSEVLIGTLSAAIGAVMLAGAVVAPLLIPRIGAGTLTVLSLACTTAGAAAIALIREPWPIAAVLAASVFLLPSLNAALLGYFMVATPSALLGRANSAAGVMSMGALPLAPLIAGFGLTWIGREGTILLCAALCLVSVVLALGNRSLRALPVESGWAAHAKRFE
ncbi:MFS transporter [Streptomyces sp. AC495_CC817]|uniref:MFS transporter n=1 Tax=Streptomyces sp. AC495_CC817 TaxID=2823900 RepID=UPI001C25C508|nr:MFS transporter [Streptomyces sp. AC495_CC817]